MFDYRYRKFACLADSVVPKIQEGVEVVQNVLEQGKVIYGEFVLGQRFSFLLLFILHSEVLNVKRCEYRVRGECRYANPGNGQYSEQDHSRASLWSSDEPTSS